MNTLVARLRRIAVMSLVLLGAMVVNNASAVAQELGAQPAPDSAAQNQTLSLPSGTLLPVNLDIKNWKHIRSGQVLEGQLSLPLYASQQAVLPAGTKVRVTIDSVERVRDKAGAWKTIGRAIVKAFNPLEQSVSPEYRVRLKAADIVAPGERHLSTNVAVLRAGTSRIVQPGERHSGRESHASSGSGKFTQKPKVRSRMLLRLEEAIELPAPELSASLPNASPTAPQEARGRAFLLSSLSGSQNHEGDRFQAVLAEPVRLSGQVFDTGSIVEGRVVRCAPPRILSRAGSLYLRIDRLVSPQQTVTVDGSLVAAESGSSAPPVLDEEGILRGRKPGLKNAIVDLGIAYLVGKATDDIAETPIRAVGAAMSDAAVANAARYFGLGSSAIFLVTRHGRDVRLPQYAEIEIDFGRVNQTTAGAN